MALKRFIAGAVCPQCKEVDAIYTEQVAGKKYRACASCGFREEMRFENQQAELETRVNRSPVRSDIQVVKLLDPSQKE